LGPPSKAEDMIKEQPAFHKIGNYCCEIRPLPDKMNAFSKEVF